MSRLSLLPYFSIKIESVVERFILPRNGGEMQRLAVLEVRHRLAHEICHHRPGVEDPEGVLRHRPARIDAEAESIDFLIVGRALELDLERRRLRKGVE